MRHRRCPCCGEKGRFRRHAQYCKYHFRSRIEILRVRCASCFVTHALIPSFSLSGTSLGCEEVEDYLVARARGASRGKSAGVLVQHGLAEGCAKRVERMFSVAVAQGKALLPRLGLEQATGLAWVESVCGASDRPLYQLNRLGLDHRVNGLCFCRRWLLHFCRAGGSGQSSHNSTSASMRPSVVESG